MEARAMFVGDLFAGDRVERQFAIFCDKHGQELADGLEKLATGSTFAASLREQVLRGRTLSDKQLSCLRRMIEDEKAPPPVGGDVDLSGIRAMFDAASASGYKRPTYRADRLRLSLAPMHGRNPGAIYVKDGGEYAGKVVGTEFQPARTAKPDVIQLLQRIAVDPLGEAVRYGQMTGRCACCGLELTNATSVRLGIGPICRRKWGL